MIQLPRTFRISARDQGGVVCNEVDGLRIGPIDLFEKTGGSEGSWSLRDVAGLDTQLSEAYGFPIDLHAKLPTLTKVAAALNEANVARAQLLALHLELPDPPPLEKRGGLSSAERAALSIDLARCGLLKADWDLTLHPRWPAGSTGGVGGQFSPAGSGEIGGDGNRAHLDGAQLIPMQGGIAIPFPWEIPDEDVPAPSEVVPFNPFLPPLTRNPYPSKPRCVKEWADAEKYCRDLAENNRLTGRDDYAGHGRSFEECVRGQISEECGGNPVQMA